MEKHWQLVFSCKGMLAEGEELGKLMPGASADVSQWDRSDRLHRNERDNALEMEWHLMGMFLNCRSSPMNTSLLARVFDKELDLFQGQATGDPAHVVEVLQNLLGRVDPSVLPLCTTNERRFWLHSSRGPSSVKMLAPVLLF